MTPREETTSRRSFLLPAGIFLLLAALLRFPLLGELPPGLFRDEAEKGYTAFQLAATGRHVIPGPDGIIVSRPLPLFIETFEGHDRTSAAYQYLAAPIVAVLGLDVWTVRLVAALAGLAAVGAAGWLAGVACGRWAALVAMGLLAGEPTAVLFSRWAQQGILLYPLTLAGFALWFHGLGEGKHRRAALLGGTVVLVMAAYAYAPARLVVPLLAVAWWALPGWHLLRDRPRDAWPAVALFTLGAGALVVYTLAGGSARLDRVSGAWDPLSVAWRYLAHLDPRFLLVEGDRNGRHSLAGSGMLGIGGGLALLAALLATVPAIRSRADPNWRTGGFFLLWVLLAPAAAALTADGIPHALRANLMVPGAVLLGGWGGQVLAGRDFPAKRWVLGGALVIATVANFGQSLAGLRATADAPVVTWERWTHRSLVAALAVPDVPVFVSAGIPYAVYHVLFAEEVDPVAFAEEGMAACRAKLIRPGEVPPAHVPGAAWVAPPRPGLPIQLQERDAILYYSNGSGWTPVDPGISLRKEQ